MRGERISDGLRANLKKSKKVYRLTENTYKEIVKMFANPSNIELAEMEIAKVLKMEKEEENRQISENFSKRFGKADKVIKMPKTKGYNKAA